MSDPSESLKMIGESEEFHSVLTQVHDLAELDQPVLIIGERGTGKELIAARLHFLSHRWEKPWVKLNCSALSESLLESELFGHESGAFTGANKMHRGRFERSDHGTLFLDELATMSSRLQEKVLRTIEYGEFERVGGSETISVHSRVIAATNENLPLLVRQGKFRADLLDRLSFEVISIPPLRFRKGDILPLADYFGLEMSKKLNLEFFPGFSEGAVDCLLNYSWPGNVRELKNVVERSVWRSRNFAGKVSEIILNPFRESWASSLSESEQAGDLTDQMHVKSEQAVSVTADEFELPAGSFPLSSYLQGVEKKIVEKALKRNHFRQKNTAAYLSLSYHQLRGLMKKHQIKPGRENKQSAL